MCYLQNNNVGPDPILSDTENPIQETRALTKNVGANTHAVSSLQSQGIQGLMDV